MFFFFSRMEINNNNDDISLIKIKIGKTMLVLHMFFKFLIQDECAKPYQAV